MQRGEWTAAIDVVVDVVVLDCYSCSCCVLLLLLTVTGRAVEGERYGGDEGEGQCVVGRLS